MAPPINPQVISALMAQQGQQPAGGMMGGMPMPPQGAGAIPQTNPVQQPTDPNSLAQLSQQQIGQIQQSAPGQEQVAARAAAVQKAQEAQQMPLPKTGPQIQKGASVGHNLGQAALMALGVTKYGNALNREIYGPGEQQYALQQAGLHGEEAAETTRAKGAQEETQVLGQVGSRGIYGAAGHEAAAKETATSRLKGVLATIANAKTMQEKSLASKSAIAQMEQEAATNRAEIAAQAHIEGITDEAAIANLVNARNVQSLADRQAAGFQQDPSLWGAAMRAFGVTGPSAAEAQPAQEKPVQHPTAAGAGARNKPSAIQYARDPQGKLHQAPAGTALPQGWTPEKR